MKSKKTETFVEDTTKKKSLFLQALIFIILPTLIVGIILLGYTLTK